MEQYRFLSVLYEGSTFATYLAVFKETKEVFVKAYQRSGILTSESLLKEAIRQAREKPMESAALIDVVLSSEERGSVDDHFCVNFVLERKEENVARELIERDDSRSQAAQGLTGYDFLRNIYAHERKKVDLFYSNLLGQEVVIKSKVCTSVIHANELLREAFILALVEHPCNCKLIDVCISKNTRFSFSIHIVMERLQCDVSAELIEREMQGERYSEEELLKFLKDVTSGLAHAKDLVSVTQFVAHRDIKPANIFLSTDGRYKLGDYGSAWKKSLHTKTLSAAGTVVYISPEMQQCMADSKEPVDSFPCDVYSLGVTVLQMAAQRLPLEATAMRVENVNKISEESLHQMAAADPVLKSHYGSRDLRQNLCKILDKDTPLAVRLNIIRTSQETLREINYRDEFKQLIGEMIAVDIALRIPLEKVIEKVEELLESLAAPQASIRQPLFRLILDDFEDGDGMLQVFDINSMTWGLPTIPSLQMQVDFATCYAFASETAVVLCGSKRHLGNKERACQAAGTHVYRVEFADTTPTVVELPNLPERRVFAGLYIYEEGMFVFGGKID